MADTPYTDLPVSVRKSDDGLRYEFGVTVDGGFVPFSAAHANVFEDTLATSKKAADEKRTEQQTQAPTTAPPEPQPPQ
jgi:hypothetical protein